MKKIVLEKTMPKSRNEREIAGYRDALNIIHENNEHIPIKSTFILQFHRDLYKFEPTSIGGSFKSADNVLGEEDTEGNKFVRFHPVQAGETSSAIEALCNAYHNVMSQTEA